MSRYKSEVSISPPWYQSTPIPEFDIIATITHRVIFPFLSAAGDSEVLSDHRRLLPAVRGVGEKSRECLLFSLRHSLLFKIQKGASHRESESAGLHRAQFVRGKREDGTHKVRNKPPQLWGVSLRGVFWLLLKQNLGIHWSPHRSPRCSPQTHNNSNNREQEADRTQPEPAALRLFHRLYLALCSWPWRWRRASPSATCWTRWRSSPAASSWTPW